ncbi:U11/U12 small nuclear ribonucleoprotein 65 kDa protein isoform X2 [Magnolia sinica]|uniref:U11/U12 small nuclear ribonucleoprotein 65 kDa protein isoform X2 n=1 Tax=Magnolia sinica TaxID=86752 RepID=UPI0026596C0F|nr:U11/U12 small nuclear ribonucleoprotein 65 kDa protein isoform X2 [Magnolia sinica]
MMSQAAESEAVAATLLVRHLPEAIPHDTLSRLFSHYGASYVRPCAGGRLRNCAFVDFKDEALASQAQSQLNRYAYPPPDGNILTNIVNALIAVPRFYTQVLHLMNKMNIPAPFRMALPTPPLPPSEPALPPPPPPLPTIPAQPHLADLSSDESEMESSEEDDADEKNYHSRKRTKREAIVGPAVDKAVAHEAVGLKPATLVPKEIPVIKKKNSVLQIRIAPKPIQNEVTDDDSSMKEQTEPANEGLELKPFVTPEEIENGKLPPEEILSLPMFKNYTAGNPSTVLYIKNLAKDVVADDFYFMFGSLFGSVETAKSGLSIKLMQEGRMRGQAFVTFPSVELALHALNLVNGYVFKGKPVIIQFGRNPAAGKTS